MISRIKRFLYNISCGILLIMDYVKKIEGLVKKAGLEEDVMVQQIKDDSMGDFAVPCFAAAKALRKNPNEIAKEFAGKICLNGSAFESVQAVGGYINFFLKKQNFAKEAFAKVFKEKDACLVKKAGKGKVVGIDFSSVNLAKHLHVGHLRNTVFGEILAKFFEASGFKVARLNYLGDYGTPYGLLFAAAEKLGVDIMKCDTSGLQDVYVSGKNFAKEDAEFAERGRLIFKDIADGKNPELLKQFEYIRKTTFAEAQKIFDDFNIKFDSVNGEFFYSKFLPEAMDILRKAGILKESRGAQIVDLNDVGLGVAILISKDGYSLYMTRDIPAYIERKREFGLDKLLYVVGSEQTLSFKQLFEILGRLGFETKDKVKHIAHGLYTSSTGKISSRDGAKSLLKDIVAEAKERAYEVLEERGKSEGTEKERRELAAKIGKAALVFSVLNYSAGKDIVFDIDRSISFEGETGPYLQYTYARICSVLKNAEGKIESVELEEVCEDEFRLAKLINNFADVIEASLNDYETYYVTKHLIEIAKVFNKFYNENRILGNKSRLYVCECVRIALEFGLKLIGIEPVEKM